MAPRSLVTALEWLAEGRRVVAATLVEAIGSAPLDPGAQMLVDDTGRIDGSVTGGCVEGALVEEAQSVLAGAPPRVATYGISDEQAVGVGLMCGGRSRSSCTRSAPATSSRPRRDELDAGRPLALATLLDGASAGATMAVLDDRVAGALEHTPLLDDSVARGRARDSSTRGVRPCGATAPRARRWAPTCASRSRPFATPPRMVIFGAIDFSAALARIAGEIGYRTTIVDAAAGLRAERPLLRTRRSRGGLAAGLPRRARARARATPSSSSPTTRSSTSRRSSPPSRPARATSARWEVAAPTPIARSACGGRRRRRGAEPHLLAVRARRRSAHAGRDGHRRPGRDPRAARAPPGRAAGRSQRPDPPARLEVASRASARRSSRAGNAHVATRARAVATSVVECALYRLLATLGRSAVASDASCTLRARSGPLVREP
jgi:xanthine/CO dehydrogenase XdhC/CoxF family maturation factor